MSYLLPGEMEENKIKTEDLRKAIFEYLADECCGYAKAKPRSEMLKYLQEKGVAISDRAMRHFLHEMIDDNYLIGSCENGYFLIDTPNDLGKAMEYLEAKAESIAIRKNELKRNYESHFQILADKQLTMIRELA